MQDDIASLIQSIAANPQEDTLALALADCLQERGCIDLATALRISVAGRGNRTIYVVTQGAYSVYGIAGVFTSEANAQLILDAFPSNDTNDDGNRIERYELDSYIGPLASGLLPFEVYMQIDGSEAIAVRINLRPTELNKCVDESLVPFSRHSLLRVEASVWAKDETHAIKIANERRIQYLLANK